MKPFSSATILYEHEKGTTNHELLGMQTSMIGGCRVLPHIFLFTTTDLWSVFLLVKRLLIKALLPIVSKVKQKDNAYCYDPITTYD